MIQFDVKFNELAEKPLVTARPRAHRCFGGFRRSQLSEKYQQMAWRLVEYRKIYIYNYIYVYLCIKIFTQMFAGTIK